MQAGPPSEVNEESGYGAAYEPEKARGSSASGAGGGRPAEQRTLPVSGGMRLLGDRRGADSDVRTQADSNYVVDESWDPNIHALAWIYENKGDVGHLW